MRSRCTRAGVQFAKFEKILQASLSELGENVIDGFGNLFTIIENTVQNVQSEMNMTSSWRNLTTIVNIQQHAFQQASYNDKYSNKKWKKNLSKFICYLTLSDW